MNQLAVPPMISLMKYSDEISAIDLKCPNGFAKSINCKSYRFVINPMSNDCFVPQAKKQPRRVQNESDLKKKCELWGLSMFDSIQNAEKKYNSLKKSLKNINKTLGDHIAEGFVTPASGVCTPVSSSGHFDVYEYSSNDFRASFSIVKAL